MITENKINIGAWVRKICSRLNPVRTAIIIKISIVLFGFAFLGMVAIGFYNMGEKEVGNSFNIEHIDSMPLPIPDDTITYKALRDGKG